MAPAPTRPESEAIIAALLAAIVELGPDASVNALARRAGVGVASLYRYFPTKDAILAELSRRVRVAALARVRLRLASCETPRQAVEACCEILLRPHGLSPAIRRALNLRVPASWSHDNEREVTAAVVAEVSAWLMVHTSVPRAELAPRVAAAFAIGRGLVVLAITQPELAPTEEDLARIMERSMLACLQLGPAEAAEAHG